MQNNQLLPSRVYSRHVSLGFLYEIINEDHFVKKFKKNKSVIPPVDAKETFDKIQHTF